MKCERCGKEIENVFGSGRFCSSKCCHSRTFSQEALRKKSEANKKRFLEKGCWGGLNNQSEESKKNGRKKYEHDIEKT